MATNQDRPKVYRLQGLPDRPDFDRLAATQLVIDVLHDPTLTTDDIQICSLATTVDPHKIWNRKVATAMFKHTPLALAAVDSANRSGVSEWRFPVPGQNEPLVLDSHFLGLTVLNDVSVAQHQFDCIALSGLASHPFGSWQPKGDDKSYMWIRDTLPTSINGVRFILYGYDTSLRNSNSFQTIVDLANSLCSTLRASGWASPSTKPLVFLAHSLGGVLLKQLLVILAGANDTTQFMLSIVKGAIFFGTPSRGMALEQLLTMVGDQPNKDLVENLSGRSEFLPRLETQFSGISQLQRMRLFWAYETQTSPTVQEIHGMYSRSGPRSIMVDHQSATGGRILDPSFTLQIDEDHSNMIKFNVNDRRISIIISKISEMCFSRQPSHASDHFVSSGSVVPDVQYGSDAGFRGQDLLDHVHSSELVGWDYDLIIPVLKVPERDQRYEQIDQNFGHTFSWAFENSALGLSKWLREGTGIFWINGKPGSGKSTFMKYLLNHNRLKELVYHWRSKPGQIIASFFFYHSGTHLQKSFEGLLMSLLSQLSEGDFRLRRIIGEYLDDKAADLYETVQSNVDALFHLCIIEPNSIIHRRAMTVLLSENPFLRIHKILEEKVPEMTSFDRLLIKETLLHDFDSLSKAIKNEENYNEAVNSTRQKLFLRFPGRANTIILIIKSWYESLDISGRIQNFLNIAHLSMYYKPVDDEHDHFAKIVERQRVWQKRLVSIQLMQWTRSDLEEGLRRILSQNAFELEICLLFDALDEYADSPEVVSVFLEDLVKKRPISKTSTKVLFSSRPWTVFGDHFDTCPSIRLHEHTMEDIHEYCAGSLPALSRTEVLIHPFVDEIANRARGVFVWVKLVMADLVALTTNTTKSDEELSQMLRQCLGSLPDELHEYYSTIIQRLPEYTRRQSYILLECMARSSNTIYLNDLRSVLACGMSNSVQAAESIVQRKAARGFEDPEDHVRTISGGMVEILDSGEFPDSEVAPHERFREDPSSSDPHNDKRHTLQLMHQTVKDWVELPTFKHIVLGSRAHATLENGHSYLVKYHMYQAAHSQRKHLSRSLIFDHAVKAEMTNGVSQYTYLSQLPENVRTLLGMRGTNFTQLASASPQTPDEEWPPKDLPSKVYTISGLHIAAYSGLSLYIADAFKHDNFVFQKTAEPLVTNLLRPVRFKSAVQQSGMVPNRLKSAKLVLNNGFELRRDNGALPLIFDGIWRSPDQETAEMYMDLALTAIHHHLPLTTRFSTDLDPGSPTSLLHLSPPILAKYLLEKGADLNMLNGAAKAPLDYILESNSVFQRYALGLDWLYDIVELLVKNGARRHQGTRYNQRLQDQVLLRKLKDNGYDFSPLLPLLDQSLGTDEQSIPPLDPRNEVSDVPSMETSAKGRMVRNIISIIFCGRGVSSRRQTSLNQ